MTSRGGVASVQPAERPGRFGSFPRFAGLFAKCAVWDSVTGADPARLGLCHCLWANPVLQTRSRSWRNFPSSLTPPATLPRPQRKKSGARVEQPRTSSWPCVGSCVLMTPSAGGSARRTAPPTPARTRRPWNWGGRVGRLGPRRSPDGSGQCSPPRPLKPAGPTSKPAIRTAARAHASTTLTSLGNRAEVIGADWDMPIATHTLQEEPGELESNEGRPGCKLRVCQPAAMPTSASPASPSLLRL